MPNADKNEFLMETYRQCFASKHHYDILSWSIAGGTLVFVGLIVTTILKVDIQNCCISLILKGILAVLSFGVIYAWYKIYERNRFWGEISNEVARDIERIYKVNGPSIAFMKGNFNKKIILKNTDVNGQKYNNNNPHEEKCKSDSMHKKIRLLMRCLVLLTIISVFIPTHSEPSPKGPDAVAEDQVKK
ncbi:MAG: hypothetical protein P9M11_10185 [Candidatus Tenebribacter burtonii]|jgi:uncharacterized membrane protein YjgN (DUF898 family)|nr:hypothetical protein [Candidatus Tenebribacter burtonii]